MGYRLGVDLGTTFTAAVVHRPGTAPTVVPLGDRGAMIPSVLFVGADGTVLMGDAAERRALTDPDRVVRRFKRRIGDETPLLGGADGDGVTAHALAARMVALVADRVAEREGGAPDAVAVTVPAAWGAHKKDLLAGALTREGLLGVHLVAEPTAAALAYAHTGRLSAGSTVAVYDFGGGTFDAAVLRMGERGTFTTLGTPAGLPNLGGIDFDDAVLAYVLGTAGPQTPGLDIEDPALLTAMARLRRECVEAKEALSADTTATVPVLLGPASTTVRLTRGEFEAMIADAVDTTCTALEAAVTWAGQKRENLDRILLVGGSSRIPLVTQLLSARYPDVPLERDIDPKVAVAIGAVLALDPVQALDTTGGASARERGAPVAGAPVAPAAGPAAAAIPAAPSGPLPAAVPTEMPRRPAVDIEGFVRAPGAVVVEQKKRRTPVVLVVAAGLIMTSGVTLQFLGRMEFDHSPPPATLQEAQVGSKHDKATGSASEASAAASGTAASSTTPVTSGKEATTSSAAADRSGSGAGSPASSEVSGSSTASGRTAGSADSRSSTSGSFRPASDATSSAVGSGKAASARDQAATQRRAAKASGAPSSGAAGTSSSVAPAAPAASSTASGPQTAAAPADTADSSTDSGAVEAFNDGSAQEPAAPPSGS